MKKLVALAVFSMQTIFAVRFENPTPKKFEVTAKSGKKETIKPNKSVKISLGNEGDQFSITDVAENKKYQFKLPADQTEINYLEILPGLPLKLKIWEMTGADLPDYMEPVQ